MEMLCPEVDIPKLSHIYILINTFIFAFPRKYTGVPDQQEQNLFKAQSQYKQIYNYTYNANL